MFLDASDISIGSALMQLTAPNWYRPVYYSSRKLSTAERNYSTTEREALGMIYSINKFRHYLLGKKFTFHVDHAALLYLVSKQSLTGKLARWMLLLQEAHSGIAGGHYAGDATTRKVWQAGLWWPMTQRDAQQYCRECDLCQRLGQPTE